MRFALISYAACLLGILGSYGPKAQVDVPGMVGQLIPDLPVDARAETN